MNELITATLACLVYIASDNSPKGQAARYRSGCTTTGGVLANRALHSEAVHNLIIDYIISSGFIHIQITLLTSSTHIA